MKKKVIRVNFYSTYAVFCKFAFREVKYYIFYNHMMIYTYDFSYDF